MEKMAGYAPDSVSLYRSIFAWFMTMWEKQILV